MDREDLDKANALLEDYARLERKLGIQAAELELYRQKYLAALGALRSKDPGAAEEIDSWA